jgi:hypothetical protein
MPLCTNCGSHDVEQTDENEYACLDCGSTFTFDGDNPEEQAIVPEGLDLDMQEFEDRISCLGDD